MLTFTDKGIYCAQADLYIDPWRPVPKAVITHAHSDHARYGMKHYLAHRKSIPVMKHRLGADIKTEALEYGEERIIGGVKLSLHPAGHIPGSSQVRLEYKGEVWLVSGDYKLDDDGLSTPFEPVKCHHFITESTFGLPVFRWPDQHEVYRDINAWWKSNAEAGRNSVLFAYALGKTQRILKHLDPSIGEVFTHGAVENTNLVLKDAGIDVPPTTLVEAEMKKDRFEGAFIIAPPSAMGTSWMRRFGDYQTGIASGWMMMRGTRRRRNADRGFVLSDHADWGQLNEAIRLSEAEHIYVTHGYTSVFTKYLQEQGFDAHVVTTEFEGEVDGQGESAED